MLKCFSCGERYTDADALYAHYEDEHPDEIPKDFTPAQYHYLRKTGKDHGSCVVCKKDTLWNPKTNKYSRFCPNPACKAEYAAEAKRRMVGKYGRPHLLSDPDKQREMLANRAISGEYVWSDKRKVPYTGSYEKDFLQFLDLFMEYPSVDIMSPSPHTYYYVYEGEEKFYIPDVYIPSLDLEIEVKDGGTNPNNHHKIQQVDKEKERRKDEVMASLKGRSYIKIIDKKYETFFAFLDKRKENFQANKEEAIVILEHANFAEPANVYYHVSEENKPFLHLHPRVPANFMTQRGFEDDAIARVSLAPTIQGCLMGMSQNLSGKKLTVYTLVNTSNMPLITPSIDQVPDAHITGEVWVTKSVTLKRLYTIEVGDAQPDPFPYTYGDNKQAELFKWDYTSITESTLTKNEDLVPVYVLLSHSGTLLANAIKSITKVPYSHSSISFDSTLDNMYSFGRKYKSNPLIGTFVKESIKEGLYEEVAKNATYSLYVTFVTQEQFERMNELLATFRNSPGFKYDFTGLFKHKIGLESAREDAYFCSGFVATILQAGDGFFNHHYSRVAPYDFAKHKRFHFVAKGTLANYNRTKVDQKVAALQRQLKGGTEHVVH